ncbi:cheW protein [Rhodovulum sulfidophilum]|uniref:CheW protein n=1 Tax=Rhodovulum sulfidophilum TaxID=35806 RepID=A0A0D6AWR4_RHOSU|nr:cheW protein [Rhodovulum sulfidophilum]
MSGAGKDSAPAAMRALTIGLRGEVFALPAETVSEILDMGPVTEVPNARAFVNGVINVRGKVVPLADLRVMFGMERMPPRCRYPHRRDRNRPRWGTDPGRDHRRQGA